MAKDQDTGIDPKAKDGQPNGDAEQARADNEFEQRKALKEARERAEEAAVAGKGGKRGAPIDDQEPPIDEEDDGQMFVWEQGRKVTLGTIIARGIPVEHAFVFGGKRLKGRGGLVAFDDDVLVVARGRVGKTSIVPTRDEDERVTKVVVETHIAAKVVLPADSDEGVGLLAGILAKRGIKAA